MSRRDSDSEKVPAALYDRLTDTPTYAARMYKVQVRPEKQALFLARLAEVRSVSRAAQVGGVDRSNLYKARAKNPGFAAAWDAALASVQVDRNVCGISAASTNFLRQEKGKPGRTIVQGHR